MKECIDSVQVSLAEMDSDVPGTGPAVPPAALGIPQPAPPHTHTAELLHRGVPVERKQGKNLPHERD